MKQLNGNLILVLMVSFLSLLTLIFIFLGKLSFYKKPLSYSDLSNAKITLDLDKIPDSTVRNEVKSSEYEIHIFPYTIDPKTYPILVTTPFGKYEYNFTFNDKGTNIDIGIDTALLNKDELKLILTRLVLSAGRQKIEKGIKGGNLSNGDLKNDHINYMNSILNNKNFSKLNIINFNE